MLKILDFFGLLLYCLIIYWLSDQPSLPAPMWFENQDKLYHAGCYFFLGVLLWRSLKYFIEPPIILALLSIVAGSLYGLSDEWHQSFVEGRSSDAVDWLADTAGVSLAVILLHNYASRLKFR